MRPNPRHNTLATELLAVLILALVGYGFLLRPGYAPYSPYSDFISQGLATKTVLFRSLQQGRALPLWRSDQMSGCVALTNPQSLYTYPFHFLFWLVAPADAVGPTFWLHFLLAGLSGLLVGRALRLGLWARLMIAVALMFSFKLILVTYAGWLPTIPGIVCFPVLFAATVYCVRRASLLSGLGVGAAVALMLHAGQPQFFYYTALALSVFLLVQAVGWFKRKDSSRAVRTLATLAGGGLLGVMLSAYLFLPLLAEAPRVSRSQPSYEFFLTDRPQTPVRLLTLFYPEALGTPLNDTYPEMELWEDVAYFGIVPLVLAAIGGVLGRKRRDTRFLVGAFIASLLLSFDSPFLRAVYLSVPGFSLFREPGRFFFMAAFFGITLAGVGLQECVERMPKGKHSVRAASVLAIPLIALVAIEGSFYARRYLRMVPQVDILPGGDLADFFAQDRSLFRVANAPRSSLNYGWAAHLHIQLATGFDPYNYRYYQTYFDILRFGEPQPARARVWADLTGISRPELLDALNVKYLVLRPGVQVDEERFPLVQRLQSQRLFDFYQGFVRGDLEIRRNRFALMRVFFPKILRLAVNEAEAVEVVKGADLHETAVVEAQDVGEVEPPQPGEAMKISETWGGHLKFETRTTGPRFAVVSEVWNPGWRARIDSRPADLHKTDIALLGIRVPGGEHTIELEFRPVLWRFGLALTGCGAAVCIAALLFAIRRRIAKAVTRRKGAGGRSSAGR